MNAYKTALIPFAQLRNVLRKDKTLVTLDSATGAFIVCDVTDGGCKEVLDFGHDGTAWSRAEALQFSRVRKCWAECEAAEHGETGKEFAIFERVIVDNASAENLANMLASLTFEEVDTVSIVAFTVRQDIRKGAVSLRALKAIRADMPAANPYDSSAFPMTAKVWEVVLMVIGSVKDTTCKALVELEEIANAETSRRSSLPELETIETISDEFPAKEVPAAEPEPVKPSAPAVPVKSAPVSAVPKKEAWDVYRMDYPEILAGITAQRAEPFSGNEAARGFLALLIDRDKQSSYIYLGNDEARDVAGSYLVQAAVMGVITGAEYDKLQRFAVTTEQPRDFIDVMRAAFLSGEPLLEAIKAAGV